MKREKQIIESKEMILKGLTELIDIKDYDDITMKDIAEKAFVTRVTLYRHFKTKEDILLYAFEKNIQNAQSENRAGSTFYDLYLFRYEILKKSPYTMMLTQKGYLKNMQNYAREKVAAKFNLFSKLDVDEYILEFIIGGNNAMAEKWVLDGMKIPCEEMAKRSISILLGLKNSLLIDYDGM